MNHLFYEFGAYAPTLLILLSWVFLWDNQNLLFYYTIGVFMDSILNLVLKGLFKQPRPSENLREFNIALKHGERFLFKDGMPHDIFGMPSGHTESAVFSTTFIYLALRKTNLLYLYGLISLITMAQRVTFNFHTKLQVLVGGMVGSLFAAFMYYLASQKVKGKITPRKDDYGPI